MAQRGCTRKAKTSKNRIEADERQTRAVELRMEGKSLSEIAAELGYAGPFGAAEAIKAALKRNQMEATDSYRQVIEARLDKMLERLWPDALDGDLDAMGMVLDSVDVRLRIIRSTRDS